jgi:hypothetical protein
MKQLIVIICLGIAFAGCNNAGTKESSSGTDSTGTATKPAAEVTLPYKLEKPYRNWQMGGTENVVAAMGALKAFVDKDFTALGALTGDSVQVRMDYFAGKLSRDSAVKLFTDARGRYNDLVITMYDYESVISADKTDEYVTIWYKEAWKDEKGVADSLSIVNDFKMKGGKMIELDEKVQHYPAKK